MRRPGQSREYFRQRRADLIARGLCLECRKSTGGYGRRCNKCARRHAANQLRRMKPREVIVPAPKKVDRIARMLQLAEFLIPPSHVGIEDIHRRKESA